MSLDLATIGIAMDTSSLEKGAAALKNSEQAANRAADAADKLSANAKTAAAASAVMGAGFAASGTSSEKAMSGFSKALAEMNRLLDISKASARETQKAIDALELDPAALAVPNSVFDSLRTWQEKTAAAAGATYANLKNLATSAWEDVKGYAEKSILIWGVAAATGIAATVLGAVYAAFKGIIFAVGLLTGESYKSANIDALIAANAEVKKLQELLPLTATGASALNQALKEQGTSATEYAASFDRVRTAVASNSDELDRLGVKYKNQKGQQLENIDVLKNAQTELLKYKEGWDRNQAAQAMGLGTEKQIADAMAVTAVSIQTAKEKLIEYNLVIGEGTQEATKNYEDAMKAFNSEMSLTSQGFSRAIADNIMPALTNFAEFFKDGMPFVVNTFRYSMATITSLFFGLKTSVFVVAESIVGSLSAVGSVIGGVAGAMVQAMQGDFSGAQKSLTDGWASAKNRVGNIGLNIVEQARANSKAMALAWGADTLKANETEAALNRVGKAYKAAPKKETATGAGSESEYDKLYKQIQAQIDLDNQSLDKGRELTEFEKLRIKTINDMNLAKVAFTATQRAGIMAQLDELEIAAKAAAWQKQANEENKKYYETLDNATKSLRDQAKAQQETTDKAGLTAKALQDLEIAKLSNLAADKLMRAAVMDVIDVTGQEGDILRAQAKLYKDMAAQKTLAFDKTMSASMRDNLQGLADETAALSMTNAEREVSIKLREIERQGLEKGSAAYIEYADKIRAAVDNKEAVGEGIKSQVGMWQTIEGAAKDTFLSIFDSGKSAFTRLKDTLKNGLYALLYEITVKRWLINIAASVSGAGVAQQALGATGGGAGGLLNGASNASSLYSAATGFSSSVNTAAGFLGAGTSAGASAASLGYANAVGAVGGDSLGALIASNASWGGVAAASSTALIASNTALASTIGISTAEAAAGALAASTAGAAGAVGIGGTVTAALASIGPVGWAAIAAGAAIALFSGSKEPASKSTGDLQRSYSATGAVTSESSRTGMGGAANAVDSIYARLSGLQKLLGAKGAVEIGYSGYSGNGNKNPMGNISGGGFNSGEVPVAELGLAAQRVILAALQSSEMPKGIANIINSLDVSKASADQIDALLANASTYSQSIKTLSASFDNLPFKNLKDMAFDAADALVRASGGLEKLNSNLGTYFQNFYSEQEQAAQKQKEITARLTAVGVNTDGLFGGKDPRADFRRLVESYGEVTEATSPAVAALLSVSGAFSELYPAAQNVQQSLASMAEQAETLRIELLTSQGKTAEAAAALRTRETAGYNDAQLAAYGLVAALKDQVSASNAASAASAKLAQDLPGVLAKFRTPTQNTDAQYASIAQNLVKAGVGNSVDALQVKLKNLSKSDIFNETKSIYNKAGTTDSTRQALLDAASALADLKDAASAASTADAAKAMQDAAKATQDMAADAVKAAQDMAQAEKALADQRKAAIDSAMQGVTTSINAEKSRLQKESQTQIDALRQQQKPLQDSLGLLTRIFDSVDSAIRKLRQQATPDVLGMEQARQYLGNATSLAKMGVLPNEKSLADALATVTSDSMEGYLTLADYRFAQAVQAGQLDELNSIVGDQKSAAEIANGFLEKQVKLVEDQLANDLSGLDKQLELAQAQVDAITGVDKSVLSVVAALAGLQAAIGAAGAARSGGGGGTGAMANAMKSATQSQAYGGGYNDSASTGGIPPQALKKTYTDKELIDLGLSPSETRAQAKRDQQYITGSDGSVADYVSRLLNTGSQFLLNGISGGQQNRGLDGTQYSDGLGYQNSITDAQRIAAGTLYTNGTQNGIDLSDYAKIMAIGQTATYQTHSPRTDASNNLGYKDIADGFNQMFAERRSEAEIRAVAASKGVTEDMVRNALISQGQIPGFASGGMFGGGLRIVGENGPELEMTGPSRIFDANTTARMMGGNDNSDVVAELRGLRSLVERLQATASATHTEQRRTANAVNGNPEQIPQVEVVT